MTHRRDSHTLKSRLRHTLLYCLGVFFILCFPAHAQSLFGTKERQKDLNFEDQVVEGMNKKPYDYLNLLGNKDGKNQNSRLYEKRTHFKPEVKQTVEELRYFK